MRYTVRKVPANFTSVYDMDTWVVEKRFDHSDPYVIATYPNVELARWCIGSLYSSIEAERGATVCAECE